MKKFPRFQFSLVVVALTALQASTFAHFKLLEPASWINADQRGDPQKVGPCGGDPKGENEKLLTNAITKITGGSKLHLRIQETIFHSGHYRVALAVNSRTELPPDPATVEKYTERGVYSVWGAIQSPPGALRCDPALLRSYLPARRWCPLGQAHAMCLRFPARLVSQPVSPGHANLLLLALGSAADAMHRARPTACASPL